jgi:hypothetical protein
VEAEDFSVVDICNAFCVDLRGGRDDMYLLAVMVSVYDNCIVPFNRGEAGDEVDPYCLPWALWDLVRLEYRAWMTGWFDPLTGVAPCHVLVHEGSQSWPPI